MRMAGTTMASNAASSPLSHGPATAPPSPSTPTVASGRSLRHRLSTHHAQQTTSPHHRLRLQYLQQLATWAAASSILPLAAFLGSRLATACEVIGCPPPPSPHCSCERCESILQPGFNCTVRIRKNQKKKSHSKTQLNHVAYICHFCNCENRKPGTQKDYVKTKLTEVAARDKLKNLGQKTALSTPDLSQPSMKSVVKVTSQCETLSDGSSRKKRKRWSSLKDLVASQLETSISCSPLGLVPASEVPLSRFSDRLEIYSKSPLEIPRSAGKNASLVVPLLSKRRIMDAERNLKARENLCDSEGSFLQAGFDIEHCQDDTNVREKSNDLVADASNSSKRMNIGQNYGHLEIRMIQDNPFCEVQEELEQGPTRQDDTIDNNADYACEKQDIKSVFFIEAQEVTCQLEGKLMSIIQNKNENENGDIKHIPIDNIAMGEIVGKGQYGRNEQISHGTIFHGLGHERQIDGKLVASEAAVQCAIPSDDTDKHTGLESQDNLKACSMTDDGILRPSETALQCSILSDGTESLRRVEIDDSQGCVVVEEGLIKSLLIELKHARRVCRCSKKSKTRNGYTLDSSPTLKFPYLLNLQGEIQCLSEQLDILKDILNQTRIKLNEANFQNNAVTPVEFQQSFLSVLPEHHQERALNIKSSATNQQTFESFELAWQDKSKVREDRMGDEQSIDMDLRQKQGLWSTSVPLQENYETIPNELHVSGNSSSHFSCAIDKDYGFNNMSMNEKFSWLPHDARTMGFSSRSPNHPKRSNNRRLSINQAMPCKTRFPVLQKIGRRWIAIGKRGQKTSSWENIMILYCTKK